MICVNPTITTSYAFRASQNNSKQAISSDVTNSDENKHNKKLSMSLAGLALLGVATVIAGKKSISTYEQALKKNGVEIKDGVAVLISNGEKYTGTVRRNTQAFGFKKETVQFSDGVITEKVYHNMQGAELEGEFYKDGKKRVRVTCDCGSEARYERYIFAPDGSIKIKGQCHNRGKDKFELARDIIKGLK